MSSINKTAWFFILLAVTLIFATVRVSGQGSTPTRFNLEGFNDLRIMTTPGTVPDGSHLRFYAKSAGICVKNNIGAETCLGGGGSMTWGSGVAFTWSFNDGASPMSTMAFDGTGIATFSGGVTVPSLTITGTTPDIYTGIAAPGGSPAGGTGYWWFDSTTKQFESKDEGGNVYKLGSHFNRVWLPAASCPNNVAGVNGDFTAGGPTPHCPDADSNSSYAGFADGNAYQFSMFLPSNWNSAVGIDFNFVWFVNSVTVANTVIWKIENGCVNPNGATGGGAPALGNSNTVTAHPVANAKYLQNTALTGITTTGCVAGYMMYVKVSRNTDTEPAVAELQGLIVTERSWEK